MEAEQKGDEVNPSESEAKEPHMEVINMKSIRHVNLRMKGLCWMMRRRILRLRWFMRRM